MYFQCFACFSGSCVVAVWKMPQCSGRAPERRPGLQTCGGDLMCCMFFRQLCGCDMENASMLWENSRMQSRPTNMWWRFNVLCIFQAAVWLRYGECLNALGELQNAVQAYKHVVELAPNHLGARVSLSALQQQLGKHDDALRTLTQGKHSFTPQP